MLAQVSYDAFGDNRTSFREIDWKVPIFCGRAVQKTPNASYTPTAPAAPLRRRAPSARSRSPPTVRLEFSAPRSHKRLAFSSQALKTWRRYLQTYRTYHVDRRACREQRPYHRRVPPARRRVQGAQASGAPVLGLGVGARGEERGGGASVALLARDLRRPPRVLEARVLEAPVHGRNILDHWGSEPERGPRLFWASSARVSL